MLLHILRVRERTCEGRECKESSRKQLPPSVGTWLQTTIQRSCDEEAHPQVKRHVRPALSLQGFRVGLLPLACLLVIAPRHCGATVPTPVANPAPWSPIVLIPGSHDWNQRDV